MKWPDYIFIHTFKLLETTWNLTIRTCLRCSGLYIGNCWEQNVKESEQCSLSLSLAREEAPAQEFRPSITKQEEHANVQQQSPPAHVTWMGNERLTLAQMVREEYHMPSQR
jgi:hypothetical protein